MERQRHLYCTGDADDSTPLRLKERQMPTHNRTDGEKMQVWMEKPLHGRHANEMNQDYVDREALNYWLTSGKLFLETGGFMLAIQDQVIPTRNHLKYIVRDPTVQNDKCRYGCQRVKTIQHVTGGCTNGIQRPARLGCEDHTSGAGS